MPGIYFSGCGEKEVSFCCLPDYHHPVQEQFRELTEYLLPKLDHEDPTAVNLGYGIYRKAMEPGMQLENIKELLYRSENSKEKIAESDTKIRDKEEYVEEMEEPPQFFRRKKRRKRTGSGGLRLGVQWGSVPAGNSHFPLSGIFSGNSNRSCIGSGNTPDGSWGRMDLDGRKRRKNRNSLQNGEIKYSGNSPE